MTKQGAITARMTSPDVCVADVNNFSIMEGRGRREAPAPSHHPRCQIRVSGGSEGGRARSRRSLKRPGRLWPPIPRGPHLCLSPRPPHLICVLFVVIRSRCGISSRSGEAAKARERLIRRGLVPPAAPRRSRFPIRGPSLRCYQRELWLLSRGAS